MFQRIAWSSFHQQTLVWDFMGHQLFVPFQLLMIDSEAGCVVECKYMEQLCMRFYGRAENKGLHLWCICTVTIDKHR